MNSKKKPIEQSSDENDSDQVFQTDKINIGDDTSNIIERKAKTLYSKYDSA